MNTFWHFGDSYAYNNFMLNSKGYQVNNFGILLSKKMNLNYNFCAIPGLSNDLIFNEILKKNNKFKKNDVIFINWSFFTRNSFVDVNKNNYIDCLSDKNYKLIKPTNEWFHDIEKKYMKDEKNFYEFISSHQFLMDYTLHYNFDWTIKLFYTINNYFKTLLEKGIIIYNLFIKENEYLLYGEEKFDFIFNKDSGINIKFNPSFSDWLHERGYDGEKEGHYSLNVQHIIADEIYKRIYNKKINKII